MTPSTPRRPGWGSLSIAALAVLGTLALLGCGAKGGPQEDNSNTVELLFTYGSEKEDWIKDVTGAFNQGGHKTAAGKAIRVQAVPLGSGESIDELLSGRRKAHLTSPASAAFLELGNARSQAMSKTDLVGPTQNLVLSPVVIAMWKSMAEALLKGKEAVDWSDILALSRDPKGWSAAGNPQWGPFRFAHTHPEYSNSGLIAVLAEVYAGAGKTSRLTLDDVNNPKVGKFLEDIEKSVVHYGSSTGFFGKKLIANGPQYLSAAVLYENMVIESYAQQLPDPLVALYPKEGTFWSDHPVGIVLRDWVTDEHKEAAKVYIDYLRQKPQQVKAMKYGFRPGDESIPLDAPLDPAHGIKPDEPKQVLAVPPAEVMDGILKLWRQHKKQSRVVLVVDVSGSMRAEQKLTNAKVGAVELVSQLGDRDELSLLSFSDHFAWMKQGLALNAAGKKTATEAINSLFARGETALYDSIDAAYQYVQDNPRPDMISAIVVLTDGEDNKSKEKLETLLEKIKIDYEKRTTRVFTIAYGRDASREVLKKIADATQAKSYEGDPRSILEVFKDIATFF
jgi:Ca-activated chloride channel family protein